MCFSPHASMISAFILTGIGLACLKKIAHHTSLLPFALLPILFGLQQICEWLVWIGFSNNNSDYIYYGSLGFLFFALIFWPIWMPFCVHSLEHKPKRKQILKWFIGIGMLCSMAMFYFACCSFSTLLVKQHLEYQVPGLQAHPYILLALYLASTIAPFFVASYHLLWIFGLGLLFAFIASATMFAGTIISLWCFFAAILSILVWVIIGNLMRLHYH